MLEQIYTSTKVVNFVSGVQPGGFCYLASWDAFFLLNFTRVDKVFRDGTQVNIGNPVSYWSLGNRQGGRHFWFPYTTSPLDCYAADEITGQPSLAEVLNPAWKIPFGTWRAGDYLDEVAGLFLHNAYNGLIKIFRLADGVQTGQIQVPSGPSNDSLAYVSPGKAMAFHKASGKVALLDYLIPALVWESKVAPFTAVAFDCRHNLVAALGADGKLRIYLLTPVPASLSSPAFSPAGDPYRLGGKKVTTQLTGDMGEPCPDYWVHWQLLGTPPQGSLWKDKSKTDVQGVAENFYFGPADTTGEETIKVRVIV
ncbi:MAG: hypothetical protein PHU44_00155 [Syntrophales bacterium]|nr:hypothetical protein [Syntrophales bacterium]MDD5640113.1 hypothetical protein [Syntrophales bacterium]